MLLLFEATVYRNEPIDRSVSSSARGNPRGIGARARVSFNALPVRGDNLRRAGSGCAARPNAPERSGELAAKV